MNFNPEINQACVFPGTLLKDTSYTKNQPKAPIKLSQRIDEVLQKLSSDKRQSNQSFLFEKLIDTTPIPNSQTNTHTCLGKQKKFKHHGKGS